MGWGGRAITSDAEKSSTMNIRVLAFLLLSLSMAQWAVAASSKDSANSTRSRAAARTKAAKVGPARNAVIVSINDVYQIEGAVGQAAWGACGRSEQNS